MDSKFLKRFIYFPAVPLLLASCLSGGPNERGALTLEGTIFGAWMQADDAEAASDGESADLLAGMIFTCTDPDNAMRSKGPATLHCNLSFEDGDPWDGQTVLPTVRAIWRRGETEESTPIPATAAKNASHHFELHLPKQIVAGFDRLESSAPIYITGTN